MLAKKRRTPISRGMRRGLIKPLALRQAMRRKRQPQKFRPLELVPNQDKKTIAKRGAITLKTAGGKILRIQLIDKNGRPLQGIFQHEGHIFTLRKYDSACSHGLNIYELKDGCERRIDDAGFTEDMDYKKLPIKGRGLGKYVFLKLLEPNYAAKFGEGKGIKKAQPKIYANVQIGIFLEKIGWELVEKDAKKYGNEYLPTYTKTVYGGEGDNLDKVHKLVVTSGGKEIGLNIKINYGKEAA